MSRDRSACVGPWTPEHDALVKRHYSQRGGVARIVAATGRTANAVRLRARFFGLRAHRSFLPWTAREDRTLRLEWGELTVRSLRAKLPGRTWVAIVCRARTLRLGSPAQGRVAVAVAARMCGFAHMTMAKILRVEGVHVERHPGGVHARARKVPRSLVDPDEARAAVTRYLARMSAAESITQAAARTGLTARQVQARLARAGVLAPVGRGHHFRVDPAVTDRAIAEWRPLPMGRRPARGGGA